MTLTVSAKGVGWVDRRPGSNPGFSAETPSEMLCRGVFIAFTVQKSNPCSASSCGPHGSGIHRFSELFSSLRKNRLLLQSLLQSIRIKKAPGANAPGMAVLAVLVPYIILSAPL